MYEIDEKNLNKILESYDDSDLLWHLEKAFFVYLLDLKKSGKTNMMLAHEYIEEEFNIHGRTAKVINKIYISHFNEIYRTLN